MLRNSLLIALLVTCALPADAQRGRGNGNRNWNNDRNRNYDRNWNHRYRDNDWNFSFSFGTPRYQYYRPYVPYRYSPGISVYTTPTWSNGWGLRPYQCRVDIEFDYWRGRPAEIEVRRCADAYGSVYMVQGSQRLIRYRY